MACNGSPMVIGLGTDHIYVASETAAFNRHTKNFIAMQDGEIAVITPTECSLDKARMEQVSKQRVVPSLGGCMLPCSALRVAAPGGGADGLRENPPAFSLVGPACSEGLSLVHDIHGSPNARRFVFGLLRRSPPASKEAVNEQRP